MWKKQKKTRERLPKSEEDKEGEREREQESTSLRPCNKMCKRRSRDELKVRQKYKMNPDGSGALLQVLSQSLIKSFTHSVVRRRAGLHGERRTRLHNWPRICQQLAWSGPAALKPLWVQIQSSCVYQ